MSKLIGAANLTLTDRGYLRPFNPTWCGHSYFTAEIITFDYGMLSRTTEGMPLMWKMCPECTFLKSEQFWILTGHKNFDNELRSYVIMGVVRMKGGNICQALSFSSSRLSVQSDTGEYSGFYAVRERRKHPFPVDPSLYYSTGRPCRASELLALHFSSMNPHVVNPSESS